MLCEENYDCDAGCSDEAPVAMFNGGSVISANLARAEQFIDASLIQELDREGFIKRLWR